MSNSQNGTRVYQDIEQIYKTLYVFARENELYEIRTADKIVYSGYFKDKENLLKCIENTRDTWYFVLNEIDEACFSRAQGEKIIKNASPTTSDNDISVRNWILIDCDPKRTSGVSATDEEKAYARKTAQRIYKWLQAQGFENPVTADSGNGYHLLYKIQAENSEESKIIIQNFLKVLDMYFSDEKVKIDTSVFNAGRITKLYGTISQKGGNTPERPHRLSRIIYVPAVINLTGWSYVIRVAEMLPKPEPKVYNTPYYGNKQFDLREFIINHGIRVKQEINFSEGVKFILEECIFDPSHKGKDAALFQYKSGALHYNCFHDSCSGYEWRDVRLKFEPDAYDDKSRTNGYKYINSNSGDYAHVPNYRKKEYKPLDFEEIMKNAPKIEGTDEPEPEFYTTEQIRNESDSPEEFIETGITEFDRRNRGFCKGEITCISGETGSGKSSLVSQFVLEAVNRGYRTALFSGELKRKRVYKWLIRQAAGKKHTRPTQYENYFIVNEEYEEPISQWLDEKVYIYNNNYGNLFSFIKSNLNDLVLKKQVDLIILDNLMSMDIEDLSDETNKQQTVFVKQLKHFAEINNVHIAFVAHPKKPDKQNLIGVYDVCGSSNIVNFVDNILIIYRVTEGYKRLKAKEFSDASIEYLVDVGNELRVCKDREGGGLNLFVPLYFEKESKRLKNSPEEIKVYGWQGNSPVIQDANDDPDLPQGWFNP